MVRPRFGRQKQHQTLGMLPWTLSWLCGSPPGCCIARSSDLSPNHRVSLFHDFPEGMYSVLSNHTQNHRTGQTRAVQSIEETRFRSRVSSPRRVDLEDGV